MTTAHSLSHTKWDCKYHIVWIPNMARKGYLGNCGKSLGQYCENWLRTEEARYWKGDCGQTLRPY